MISACDRKPRVAQFSLVPTVHRGNPYGARSRVWNQYRCGQVGLHSHAGAWERGGAGRKLLWFPRSSVGTHTELERQYGVVVDMDMPVCIPARERGNEVGAGVTLVPTVLRSSLYTSLFDTRHSGRDSLRALPGAGIQAARIA